MLLQYQSISLRILPQLTWSTVCLSSRQVISIPACSHCHPQSHSTSRYSAGKVQAIEGTRDFSDFFGLFRYRIQIRLILISLMDWGTRAPRRHIVYEKWPCPFMHLSIPRFQITMNSSTDDSIGNALAPYFTAETIITQPLATLSAMFFIYGIYVVIFALSVHTLSRGPASKIYTIWTITLFVLATIYIVNNTCGFARQATIEFNAATTKDYTPFIQYLSGDVPKSVWFSIGIFVPCFMNAIADWMLIHRCYMIWKSKILVYLLAFVAFVLNAISLGTTIAGIIADSKANQKLYQTASSVSNGTGIGIAIFQMILALLTASRIWWVSRQSERLMGRPTEMKYNSIAAAIIESGALYAVSLVVMFIYQRTIDPDSSGLIPFDVSVISTLLSGLAPTLIVVRVAYGKPVDNLPMLSTLHFAEEPRGNGQRSAGETDQFQFRRQSDAHELDRLYSYEGLSLPAIDENPGKAESIHPLNETLYSTTRSP
ncbi:hypothetical protein E1B28_013597 [Marasmius oreades]|uniref:Uncharacterized protein n=1 Tax=Marasmius oreades TaxID=181124 RepID=A0A9P7UN65_9AGAR|nr:uncharacterized protein E1B28_013597 [Marasmius oreades]KAG7087650.1 hypothetical protein E1B28_013597 [Marasmius oreades]